MFEPSGMWSLPAIWIALLIVYWNVEHLESCKFPDHWDGNWYQSGIRKTISIAGNRFSSKGSCVAAEGDKFLIANDDHSCYRCVVIHEKHYNVLQYKETFCHPRDTLTKICGLITGEALLYSMFRENANPITCPFKPPYTFTYNRGHGECRYPVSTIDSCTQESRIVIQYQACPDVYGSESALEEIQCLAVWKEGSYRYLVGKVSNNHIATNEDHYRCFVFEKSTASSITLDADSPPDREVEYRIAQSGDATCTGLFSPAEGSRTMILKRTPLNYKCKFPSWMTKRKQWHTLDYSYSYTFIQHNSTLRIANTTTQTTMNENYYLNERVTRHNLFNGDEIRINCVDSVRSTSDGVQLLTHYLTECQRGFLCIALHRRSDHIVEIQIGTPTARQEDACHRSYFESAKTPYITLVTPEPESKVCPFFGNFLVNGVSAMEQSVTEKLASEDVARPYLSSVDIMGTYSDALSQTNFFRADNQLRGDGGERDGEYETTYSDGNGGVRYARRRVLKRDVNYVGFQSNARLNLSSSYVLSSANATRQGGKWYQYQIRRKQLQRPSLQIQTVDRRKRSASSGEKKNSCILNFNKLNFGCRSPDTMEFRSDCPLFSSDVISMYLCHGSWIHNVSQNTSVHYLVTTPLSRTSHGVRRYCFMYQTNEDSSLIHFTSTSDTCHRDNVPGSDGALSFNITPIGAGKCAELNSSSTPTTISYQATIALILHYVVLVCYRMINR